MLKGLFLDQFRRIISSAIGGGELFEDLGGASITESLTVDEISRNFKQNAKAAARSSGNGWTHGHSRT